VAARFNQEHQAAPPQVDSSDNPSLPGMENVDAERDAARRDQQGEDMTGDLQTPKGSIDKNAGDMERNSPIFRGTDASPQNEMFPKHSAARS
jgi:hypothetical protein